DGSHVCTHTDISIRKMVEEQFRASERQLRNILEASPIAVGVTQVGETTLIFGNSRLAELFGIAPADLIGCDTTELMLKPEEYEITLKTVAKRGNLRDMEVERTRQDGSRFSVLLSVDIIRFEGKEATLWWAYDITEQKQIRAQLAVLAHRDTLTGLANRRLFQDHLSHSLARTRRKAKEGALLYLDLDGFKQVNDSHGHEHGDWVLTEIARRITECVRESDLVARVGGDEFILVLEESHEPEAVEAVAGKVLDSLARPFVLNGEELVIGASIGIAYFGSGRITPDQLIHQADLAMYRAKRDGRGRYVTFDPKLDDA
ncbi:MAG TPA: sensor domain-containing diguanylate cyclase, partial [Alphaproteobacteria bacterium]|nr:sensor domain-containing diguanylate cyclase [Alphaproteobacteria bacterium]